MVNSTTSSLFISLFLLFAATAYGQKLKDQKDFPVKFEVLSVRLAKPEERPSDVIGIDTIVRLRLSNEGPTTVFFYNDWKQYIAPTGYLIRSVEDRIEWFVRGGFNAKVSPGIERLMKLGDGGEWLALVSRTAIEFELYDSTKMTADSSPREKHAMTIFAKAGEKGIITEVHSDFYDLSTAVPK